MQGRRAASPPHTTATVRAPIMATADREFLLEQAARFRRLAREVADEHANRALEELALEYEAEAGRIIPLSC
jgi:hypothetical protein